MSTVVLVSKESQFSFEYMNGEIYSLVDNDKGGSDGPTTMALASMKKIKFNQVKEKHEKAYILRGNYTGKLPVLIYFIAASPANHFYGTSASRYRVPYPNEMIAFENTPNHKMIRLETTRHIEIPFFEPSPYYAKNGTELNDSKVYLKFVHYPMMMTHSARKDDISKPSIFAPTDIKNAQTFVIGLPL